MCKRILAFLFILLLSAVSLPAALADEPSAEKTRTEIDAEQFGPGAVVERDENGDPVSVNGFPVRTVRAGLTLRPTDAAFQCAIDFVDYPFFRPATAYDGNLAVMSLAMALSANRAKSLPDGMEDAEFDPSVNLELYLQDAGFTNIREDDYSKETSMYTVSTAMGMRRMERPGEAPFTLIAIGVCGGGYKNEWQSNMTPGSGELHEGFLSAADLVIDRLAGYLMTNGIEGPVKIWISGFSRAAAVSNLTAGLLVRDGSFAKEDVYAYTFATPAAVFDPPETGYENIFNIMNPMDLVPQVMPADWGYGRFGQDLYLPVTEFSSVGNLYTATRAEHARELFGIEANYSPALNLRTRLLLSMLLDAVGSRDGYNERLQPAVVGIMQNKNVSFTLTAVRDLLLTLRDSSPESRKNTDAFVDYLIRVFGNTLTRTEIGRADRNSGNVFVRLFAEHREDAYLANIDLLRSGTFEEDLSFTYVMVRGPVNLYLTRTDRPGERTVLTEKGEIRVENPFDEQNDQQCYMERVGKTSIVAVPCDADFTITWEAVRQGNVEIRHAVCSVYASARYPGAASGPFKVKAGAVGTAFLSENGESVLPDGFTETVFNARQLASFIGIASVGVNWRLALTLLCTLLGILFTLIAWAVTKMRPAKRKLGFAAWFLIGVFCVALPQTEAAYWFFADMPWVRIVWKAVLGAALVALFFLRHRPVQGLMLSLFPGLLVAVIADIAIGFSFPVGVGIFLLCHTLLIISFLYYAPMRVGRWIQWAIVALGAGALIVLFFSPRLGLMAWGIAAYAVVLLLMFFCGGNQSVRIRYASGMFLISDMLLGVFFTVVGHPGIHVAYMLLFYLSLLLMAIARRSRTAAHPSVPDKTETA